MDREPSEGHSEETPFQMTLEGSKGSGCLQARTAACQPLGVEMWRVRRGKRPQLPTPQAFINQTRERVYKCKNKIQIMEFESNIFLIKVI